MNGPVEGCWEIETQRSESQGAYDYCSRLVTFTRLTLSCNFGSEDVLLLDDSIDLATQRLNQLDGTLLLLDFALNALD